MDGKGSGPDTVQAIVLYGDKFLFDPSRFSTEKELMLYIDSVLEAGDVDLELLKSINLFVSVRKRSTEDVYRMIDSLFELPETPFALINQINYFVANRIEDSNKPSDGADPSVDVAFNGRSLGYAEDDFYESWNTTVPHPFTDNYQLVNEITLVLADSTSHCFYSTPVKGEITSPFGWRDGKMHKGIDIDLKIGTPVHAAFDGMVRLAKKHGAYGNVIIIRHYNGLESVYAHLHKLKVKPGQLVESGQVIGLGGNTGRSTGPHLHFELRFKGFPINPKNIISFRKNELNSSVIVVKKTRNGVIAYPEGTIFHTVESGETLSEIAGKYGTSTARLRTLNNFSKNKILRVGQKVRIS